MNFLIIFSVIFSIIIGDIYGKSFDFEQLLKLSTIKKRAEENILENILDIELDPTPCPVIECLIITDSAYAARFDTEEEIIDYINDLISATQNILDGLELNITLRLIGRISYYTNETEPDFIKKSLYTERPRTIIANEVIVNMRDMEKFPIVEKADIIVVLSGRQVFSSRPKPGEGLGGEINGMAWVQGVCNSVLKFAIVSDDRHLSWTIDTFVHEVGHLINVGHSDVEEGLEGCSSVILPGEKYSSCSKKTVKEHLNSPSGACMFDNCDNSNK
ncbi:venom metalloproteinase antarease-like TpachMP_A [Centruroides sculpturatus]|uniref:venom metalloproteinase antarease-like TpachMP_A n=1 Tax=Centruroides sculpturatus TaxID=218467 RepID=UPI000C6EA56C|nr:venom metalloproteinase antarease-like TpachMP_A [Centruroides sculpturatus]